MYHQALEITMFDEFFNSIDEKSYFNTLSVIVTAKVTRTVGRFISERRPTYS
jgi:hypothetical protein